MTNLIERRHFIKRGSVWVFLPNQKRRTEPDFWPCATRHNTEPMLKIVILVQTRYSIKFVNCWCRLLKLRAVSPSNALDSEEGSETVSHLATGRMLSTGSPKHSLLHSRQRRVTHTIVHATTKQSICKQAHLWPHCSSAFVSVLLISVSHTRCTASMPFSYRGGSEHSTSLCRSPWFAPLPVYAFPFQNARPTFFSKGVRRLAPPKISAPLVRHPGIRSSGLKNRCPG